jgi:amino-acid N-acetyltransferase
MTDLLLHEPWVSSHPPRQAAPSIDLRPARPEDVSTIHALISAHVASDHLLPRTVDEITARLARFVVAVHADEVVGCAELAMLSDEVVEIRSLVVAEHARGLSVGRRIIDHLVEEALAEGRKRLCAFTHQPGYFVRLGFSIVPHLWLREKVFTDCVGCPLFRACGQHAMMLKLDELRSTAPGARRVA